MNTIVRETLEQLIALYQDPSKHCKNEVARDKDGVPCGNFSPDATSWCIGGALEMLLHHSDMPEWKQNTIRHRVEEEINSYLETNHYPFDSLYKYMDLNDTYSVEDIVEVLNLVLVNQIEQTV